MLYLADALRFDDICWAIGAAGWPQPLRLLDHGSSKH
jgi:hypothetical protein